MAKPRFGTPYNDLVSQVPSVTPYGDYTTINSDNFINHYIIKSIMANFDTYWNRLNKSQLIDILGKRESEIQELKEVIKNVRKNSRKDIRRVNDKENRDRDGEINRHRNGDSDKNKGQADLNIKPTKDFKKDYRFELL